MKTITPEQKQINKLTRELRSLYSQLSYTQIARDQWRKRCAAKDEKGGRSAASTIAGLREERDRDQARYQEHLSQKVRALEANKVTIADMDLELKDLRGAYEAKRGHALTLNKQLDVTNQELGKALAYVAELQQRLGVKGKKGAKGKPPAIDSPTNWALLNERDKQWKLSLVHVIQDVEMITTSLRVFLNQGPTPPDTVTADTINAAVQSIRDKSNATLYREVPDPATGEQKLDRITRDPEPIIGSPVPGGNGVWSRRRKDRKRAKK